MAGMTGGKRRSVWLPLGSLALMWPVAAAAAVPVPDISEVLQSQGLPVALGLAFVGGILLSLTPCVYHMIPVTVAIFGAHGATRRRGFSLSLCYVLGIATTYTALGVWAALSGRLFGSLLAHPAVLWAFATLFTLLGLHLLDWFPRVDGWLSRPMTWAARVRGAGFGGEFLMGTTAGIVFAPCVGPVLVGILAYVATRRDAVLGGALLFVFALGMGVLFIVLGTFSGALARLPRTPGLSWSMKLVLAALVFAGGLYFWSLALPAAAFRWTLAASALPFALRLGLPLQLGARVPLRRRLAQTGGVILLLGGGLVGLGGLGSTTVRERESGIAWRTDYEAAMRQARGAGRPLLIDFTADWCLACKELERFTFRDDEVVTESRRFVAVRVDATRMEDTVQKILREHSVMGLPAVVFVNSEGQFLQEPRVTAFVEAGTLLALMQEVR